MFDVFDWLFVSFVCQSTRTCVCVVETDLAPCSRSTAQHRARPVAARLAVLRAALHRRLAAALEARTHAAPKGDVDRVGVGVDRARQRPKRRTSGDGGGKVKS